MEGLDIHPLLPPVNRIAANLRVAHMHAGADRCPGPDVQPLAAAGGVSDVALNP
jgi:hypothetical protein